MFWVAKLSLFLPKVDNKRELGGSEQDYRVQIMSFF